MATAAITWNREEPASLARAKGGEHILKASMEKMEKVHVLEAIILPKITRGVFTDKIIIATGSPH